MPKSLMSLVYLLPLTLGILATDAQFIHAAAQPSNDPQTGTLEQIVPGYYAYTSGPRISGVIVTSEGVVVVDALSNEAMATHERQLISDIVGQPVRYLISSTYHGNYSRGNVAYQDVISIGHEDYNADLLDLMEAEDVPMAEQEARLPDLTFRDRMTLRVGDKEIQIIHIGPGHTRGDSIVFVPEDRIVYASEAFFYERFPFMNGARVYELPKLDKRYRHYLEPRGRHHRPRKRRVGVQRPYLNWINAIDIILNLEADIIVPGNGEWVFNDPQVTRQALVPGKFWSMRATLFRERLRKGQQKTK